MSVKMITFEVKQGLKIEQRAKPLFSSNQTQHIKEVEARISVKAFGINRADLLQRAGHYPAPKGTVQDVLGLEFAGVITEFSDGQSRSGNFSIGDRVMGICSGGAYSEELVIERGLLMPIPEQMSFELAASIPEAYLTAFDALVERAQLKCQEHVLIHALGSGVGCATAHIAHFLGAKVTGTTRSAWKKEKALEQMNLNAIWLAKAGRFTPPNSSAHFNVIIDFIGAAYLEENLKSLNTLGRLVIVGLLGGVKSEINLGLLLAKRAQIVGTVLRSRPLNERIKLTRRFCEEILPQLQEIKPNQQVQKTPQVVFVEPVYQVSQPHELEKAHQDLAEGKVWAKLVCRWDND